MIFSGILFFQNQPYTDIEEIQEAIAQEIKVLERPSYPNLSKSGKVLVTRNDDFQAVTTYLSTVNTCQRAILEGHWVNFTLVKGYTKYDQHLMFALKDGNWPYSGKFNSANCDIKYRDSDDMNYCLKPGERRAIIVVGDSMGRLLTRVIHAMSEGKQTIQDVTHEDSENFKNPHASRLKYFWSTSFKDLHVIGKTRQTYSVLEIESRR